MEIGEIWKTIDSRIDWFLAGTIGLLLCNLLLPLYVGWTYISQEKFHRKHNLQPSTLFIEQSKMLEDLPTMDDIEISEPEGRRELPQQYVQLQSTDLFIAPGSAELGELVESGGQEDTSNVQQVQQKPRVDGFEIVGRIFGKGDAKASILRKMGGDGGENVTTYVAREGDYLENTDIRVITISDTMVQLNSPEHRVTTLQFDVDQISQRIRESIKLR